MKEKLTTAYDYLFGLKEIPYRGEARQINDAITRAFKAGVKEGRRRHQGYLARLIAKGRYDETELPIPKNDDRLPGYHDLLNHLCDELGVAGAVTFAQAVASVKKRLERKGETFPRIDKGFFSE